MTIEWHLLVRVAVAAALGAVIGLERDRRGRPAGLRTHTIVALASATFMVVSVSFIEHQSYTDAEHVEVDVSRIAASIVTGIGFLGGGAIMRTGLNVMGLTTAAGLWLVGAIGMAAGGGMYVMAVFSTALGLVVLSTLRRFEDKDDRLEPRHVRVTVRSSDAIDAVLQCLAKLGARVTIMDSENAPGRSQFSATLDVRAPRTVTHQQMQAELARCEGLESARVERAES
jgi:putative Mg2+ transporter-C (MgtC) family protein